MELGPHAATIVLCYDAVAMVLALLIGWLIRDGRRLERTLADLEARGVRRRSATRPESKPEPNTRA